MRSSSGWHRCFVTSLLAVIVLMNHPAQAQPVTPTPPTHAAAPPPAPLGESLTGQAKDEYESARILLVNGDSANALVKFQHAFDLSSDVRLLWDMGICEKNMHRYARVLRLVERYLHDGDMRITEAQRAEAVAVVRTVRALVSTIRVVVNEPGASVFVDDEPAGTTPLTEGLLVDLGDRRIRVNKPGFKEQVIVQHVAGASEATVTVALDRENREGRLTVSADSSAAIRVDGTAVGIGQWEGPLAAGSHAIQVTAPGMVSYSQDVVLREGESRAMDVTLRRESSGISPVLWWIGGGVMAAAGLGVGGYFLLRQPQATTGPATQGTIAPFTVTIQARH
jgi:PEGA domain